MEKLVELGWWRANGVKGKYGLVLVADCIQGIVSIYVPASDKSYQWNIEPFLKSHERA